ncbi:hypothetical protein [Musicola keenii]|uniref:hypothetical protein n=1 Tax=Musicola keenii TaxID=2884250 RepID=UPI00177B32F0|nr:hypothetical protein [Musicola keenii]
MFIDLKEKMVSVLSRIRERGYGPSEAVEHIIQSLGSRYNDVSKVNVLTPSLLADVIYTVYQEETSPLEIASILRVLGYAARDVAIGLHQQFPQLAPDEVGSFIMDDDVYPGIDRKTLIDALSYAGFSRQECDQAEGILYS